MEQWFLLSLEEWVDFREMRFKVELSARKISISKHMTGLSIENVGRKFMLAGLLGYKQGLYK